MGKVVPWGEIKARMPSCKAERYAALLKARGITSGALAEAFVDVAEARDGDLGQWFDTMVERARRVDAERRRRG